LDRTDRQGKADPKERLMGPRVADTGVITAVHLAILAVVAVIVIAGIVWGVRLQRQRNEARRIETERVEVSEGVVADTDAPIAEPGKAPEIAPAPEAAPVPVTPSAPPVAPSPAVVAEEPADPAPLADEPIPAAAPLDAFPATVADPTPAPVTPESAVPAGPPPGDRSVTLLKGLGPKVAARLAELGVTTVAEMAALDATQAETIDARLGPFTGRMARDRWIEQARFLAAGDVKGFEAVFGRL
jgi:predicted flap endonuclease-1-like 5' DNA nuclease